MRDNAVTWLLLGALLGGVINAAVRRYATFKEGKGIALALRGEMSAIIEMVLQRRYLQHLEKNIQKLADSTYKLTGADIFAPSVPENYFPVFNSLGTKIGLLNDLSDSVASFYTKAKSVVEDIHNLEEMRANHVTGSAEVDRATLLALTTELRDLLHDTLRIGLQAVEDLKLFQERTWFVGIR